MAQDPPKQTMQIPPLPAAHRTVPRLNDPTGVALRAIATDLETWKQQLGAWLKPVEWQLQKDLSSGGTQWVPPPWPGPVTYPPNMSDHLMLVQFAKALDDVKEAVSQHLQVWIYNAKVK